MDEVLRPDIFELKELDFNQTGFYQLRKSIVEVGECYLEQILVVESEDCFFSSIPAGYVGVIYSKALFIAVCEGDIATINSLSQLRVILSRNANHNTLLVTERCNNLCLFCSQPPKKDQDQWLLTYAAKSLAAFDFDGEIGISGGEPLIYGLDFINFLDFVANYAPRTKLHVLTNGRAFSDIRFTKEIALRCRTMGLVFGIPLYSSRAHVHDELVGARGAFSETVTGMINAGNSGINMEVRFIPTKVNSGELAFVAEYINRVFSGVVQLSIMNLEATGWAKKNWQILYDCVDNYIEPLQQGICVAEESGLNPTLFNYPLCHLPEHIRPYAVKSISDWKNYYPEECKNCQLLDKCGGYFVSSRGKYHQEARRII